MEVEYSTYICKCCKMDNLFINKQVEENKRQGRYISCGYCGSKRLKKEVVSDSLKKCMDHISFKRKHGAIVQR